MKDYARQYAAMAREVLKGSASADVLDQLATEAQEAGRPVDRSALDTEAARLHAEVEARRVAARITLNNLIGRS